jgi:hypothetical protein
MATEDGLIGAMSQTTQHAIALVWGALIPLLVLGGIGWRLKARIQRRPRRDGCRTDGFYGGGSTGPSE